MKLHPQRLNGHWRDGYALDLHTVSSTPIHEVKSVEVFLDDYETEIRDEVDIIGWDTKRTEIGEHVYKLKYWKDLSRFLTIADEAARFLNGKTDWNIDLIIPVPPSDTTREFQPVEELAKEIGAICKLAVDLSTLKKLKSTPELKDIRDPGTRREILKDAFGVAADSLDGKNVLLFDDLYRSGETLNAVCDIIKNRGNPKNVYALTITKTRSNR